MAERPTGTVTFLFTDVEGSTHLWEEFPAEMEVALERHDEILRSAIASHGGYVFSTAGDAFAAAFARAGDAVAAAKATQDALEVVVWPTPISIRVRVGLHTGEGQERGGDYFGPALNRAARIMSAGHGGQVLVSSATAGVVSSEGLMDLGEHRLKDLGEPERILQLGEREFPPLQTLGMVRNNLPIQRTELVGRDADVERVMALLAHSRLVTLTGVGGVGKTRLALATAAAAAEEFRDGVWLVELAKVLDGASVAAAVAATLGIQRQSGLSDLEAVVAALEPQRLLVVLDNCEHVLDEAAELVDGVLNRAPGVKVLATSREGLAVAGERLVAVRSLETGGEDSPAVELFVDRASAAGWIPAQGELAHVVELCAQLDGVPLAIELAAARARSMGAGDIVGRLGNRFRLLKGRRRSIERHQTLRATVAWSYDLLDVDEQRMFDRLSVFVGGFDLEAAERVCGGDELDELDVDDLISALVDKSMVATGDSGFSMLETLRQFGEDQLAGTNDSDRFRDAHLAHYRQFVTEAHDGLWGSDEAAWWDRLRRAWPNVRAAFGWAIETGNADAATTIVAHLGAAATFHEPHEPWAWAVDAIALPGAENAEFYACCLAGAAAGLQFAADLAGAEPLATRAWQLQGEGAADLDGLIGISLAGQWLLKGRTHESLPIYRAMADQAAERDQPAQHAAWLASLAFMGLVPAGDFEQAAAVGAQAHQLAELTGNPTARAWARLAEAAAYSATDPARSVPVLEDALSIAESAEVTWVEMNCHRYLASTLARLGRHHEGLRLAIESVRTARRQGAWLLVWTFLFYTAFALEALGAREPAARLLGGVAASTVAGVGQLRGAIDGVQARLAENLGEAHVNELLDQGRQLTPQQAVDLAEAAASAALNQEAL